MASGAHRSQLGNAGPQEEEEEEEEEEKTSRGCTHNEMAMI